MKAGLQTHVFFATDVHGSTSCFEQWLEAAKRFRASVLIMGGDVTGKILVPVIDLGNGTHAARDKDENLILRSEGDVHEFVERCARFGRYAFRCDVEFFQQLEPGPEADRLGYGLSWLRRVAGSLLAWLQAAVRGERRAVPQCAWQGAPRATGLEEEILAKLICERLSRWVETADERLAGTGIRAYFNAGNDDPLAIDAIIDSSATMERPEGKLVAVDDTVVMLSCGYANLTPWRLPRDIPEDELRERIEVVARHVADFSRCVFNLHCPPKASGLDRARLVGYDLRPRMTGLGPEEGPVGSSAVREAIEKYQPCVSLHGHIHESPGQVRIGKTLCINPGSEYETGLLLHHVGLTFEGGELVHWRVERDDDQWAAS